MTLDISSLRSIPLSFASCSIGCRPEHSLPRRIEAISAAGFTAIELPFPDLISFACEFLQHKVDADNYDELCIAAREVKVLLQNRGMKVMMLQPFANFEGWPMGSKEREEVFSRARGWLRVMEACGTDLLQVGSTDTPASKIDTDREQIVDDLRELSDMLAEHHFRLAYENWCWSTHAPDWKDVWQIVQQVNRPNIGLCLDTFQSAGGEWADPTTKTGRLEGLSLEQLNHKWYKSLDELSSTVPKEKTYLLQISDAYKLETPLSKDSDESGTRPRGRWSHDYRPLPYDGGYLPVADFARAVLKTGFRGWFSYEVFDSGPDGKGRDYDIMNYAKQAFRCQGKLIDECVQHP